jgi:hypothetical protein
MPDAPAGAAFGSFKPALGGGATALRAPESEAREGDRLDPSSMYKLRHRLTTALKEMLFFIPELQFSN